MRRRAVTPPQLMRRQWGGYTPPSDAAAAGGGYTPPVHQLAHLCSLLHFFKNRLGYILAWLIVRAQNCILVSEPEFF